MPTLAFAVSPRRLQGQQPLGGDHRVETAPIDELHHDRIGPATAAHRVDRHDVRVLQRRNRAPLAKERRGIDVGRLDRVALGARVPGHLEAEVQVRNVRHRQVHRQDFDERRLAVMTQVVDEPSRGAHGARGTT